uniref:Uncharacterized protein n=1 Tax=Anopheles atroparvus TaxID=41427 RepID=A0A182ITD5_ANOAO
MAAARAWSPEIFSLPVINAFAGFSLPVNISKKCFESIVSTASAFDGGSPLPTLPVPFFRSANHVPASSPFTLNSYTAPVLRTISSLSMVSIFWNSPSILPPSAAACGFFSEAAFSGATSRKKSGISLSAFSGTHAYCFRSVMPSACTTSSSIKNLPLCSFGSFDRMAYAASAMISGLREN